MKKLTILVDMDDTIENMFEVWLARINEKFDKNVKMEDVNEWRLTDVFTDLTLEEIFSVLDDSIWLEVEPIENASEVLQRFIAKGHEIYIVTTTPYDAIKAKMDDMLFKWFPFLSWKDVIITSNKQLIRGDVLIDDAPHNLIDGEYKRILVDAPYNRKFDDEKLGFRRVYNWLEIEQEVDSLAEN